MKFVHIGWCREGTSDKVWGVILIGSEPPGRYGAHKYLIFWGRRGKKLQTKFEQTWASKMQDVFDKKLKGGYNSIDPTDLERVYPEFREDLEKTTVWAILSA